MLTFSSPSNRLFACSHKGKRDHLNNKMLNRLTSQVHDVFCTDEVDETCSTRKWSKKAAES